MTHETNTSRTCRAEEAPAGPAVPPARRPSRAGRLPGLRRVVPGLVMVASTAGGLALSLPASPAAAQAYGPQAQCVMTVDPTAVYAGQSFTVVVTVGPGSLPAGATAPILISGSTVPLGSIAVPTTGAVSTTLTAPTSIGPGLHTITVQACSAVLATSVVVQPSTAPSSAVAPLPSPAVAPLVAPRVAAAVSTPPPSSGLAFTGTDAAATAAVGAAAVGAGGAIVLIGRRRRSRA